MNAKQTVKKYIQLTSILFLFVSIYRTTAIRYSFMGPNNSAAGVVFSSNVEYSLPYPGMLPDHPLWSLKVFRDRLILFLVRGPSDRANRLLFLADQRLVMAKYLCSKGGFSSCVVTAHKAEKYLVSALVSGRDAEVRGYNMDGFFETIAKASLVHRELLERMMARVPDTAKPVFNEMLDDPRRVYEQVSHDLNWKQKDVPTP